MFGSITSDPDLNTAESGAFKFSGYFLQDEGVSQLSSDDKWYAYSGPPVQLQWLLMLDIESILFDSNYLLESYERPLGIIESNPSEAISCVYCKGTANYGNFTSSNLNGLDLDQIKSVLGETESSYIIEAAPNERGLSTGDPETSTADPNYYVDFGVKNFVIDLLTDLSEGSYVSKYDLITFDSLSISNLTWYNPVKNLASIIFFSTDVTNFEIEDISITDSNFYRWYYGALRITNLGYSEINNGSFINVNKE